MEKLEKVRKIVLGRRYLIVFVILTIVSGLTIAYVFLSPPEPNNSERFQIIHDFGNYYSDDMEVTYYGSFLVAAADGLIEVTSDSSVSSIPSFTNLSVRDIEIENSRDRITHGVIAYIASDHGVSVLYAWGERRQDLNLSVDAERALGFNPHRLSLSPSGQYLYIYDSVNGVYSVDLDNSFYFADQRFIPELLNESTQSWPFDYGSPMNGLQLTHMTGTNEGILLGGESGLFFFDKTSEVWSNTTLTHQTTTLEVECFSYMPSDRTIFVGTYGGIERFQLVGSNIVSTGEVLLPGHEWDAIYAIEYDLYFNRLYAGSPDGLYIFFLNNDTTQFFSQEQAQWTGFSVFSIGTIQIQPSSIYFSTLSECYILNISVQEETVPDINDFVQIWIPILLFVIGCVGLLFTALNTYYRREQVKIQKESVRTSPSENNQGLTSVQAQPTSEKRTELKDGSSAAVVINDSEKGEQVKTGGPHNQCIMKLIDAVKEAKSFLYGQKNKSSFICETQHKTMEDGLIELYYRCGKQVPTLRDFVKHFRNSMGFIDTQLESVISLADQIIHHLNDTIDESL